ncbi:hypothetical protein BJ170DRAFT_123028 [Xylariales sp. AK1849]|nr:hypothetical protein BJ170DRAFT_123028 [Xylariales sp. AK1849]
MPSHILSEKDINVHNVPAAQSDAANGKPDVKSMEYHRQVLQSKIEEDNKTTYISPSDTIMSPCTAKLNAFRNKQVGKAKPKSLFAQASAKKLDGDNVLGAKSTTRPSSVF